jgi:TolB-like protein
MKATNFFGELKRRNVYKVAVAYAVAGWALSQGIAQVFPAFDVPNWAIRSIVLLIIVGLPIALVLAWMFELTPHGIKRTETADAMPATSRQNKRAWIYVVVIGGLVSIGLFFLGRYTAPTVAPLPAKSIAVLPFENLSEDKANAYFADGIQVEIPTRLAKIADLKVISRTSTQRYQSKPGNLAEIAKQLGVSNILEGSVQKAADQVRVNVQLVNVQTDSQLWAETYDRKLTDIFSVESEIAIRIAESLQAKLSGHEEQALAAKPTNNPEAYDAYLRGLAFEARSNYSSDAIFKAIDFYGLAVQLDPNFALAWARLSGAHALLYFNRGDATDARRQAEGNLQEAAKSLVQVNAQTNSDMAVRIKLTQLRLERNPTEATQLVQARQARLEFTFGIGKGIKQVGLALLRRVAGDTAQAKAAAEQGRNTLEPLRKDQPDNVFVAAALSVAYAILDEKDSALNEAQRAITLVPSSKDRLSGPAFEENLALVELIIGENSRAISTLTRLLKTPYSGWLYSPTPITPALLRLDQIWDPLRVDPGFQKLCEQEKQ